MPISKERQKLYPGGSLRSPEWLSIRAEILEREGHRCAFCKAPDRTMIVRDGRLYRLALGENNPWYDDKTGKSVNYAVFSAAGKLVYIILTIAHLDQDPTNNGEPGDRPNLAALCQKCHNAHDAPHRAANARETRLRKKPLPLFDGKD